MEPAFAFRLETSEKTLATLVEKQARTDERVTVLTEGQKAMQRELADVLVMLKDMRAAQDAGASKTTRWLQVLVVMVPAIPALMRVLGF